MSISKKRHLFLVAAGIVLLFPMQGSAQALQSTNYSGAANNCEVTDSSYAPNFKVRALSSDNTGSGNIYVTCALQSDPISAGINFFRITLHNTSSASITVNCTGVAGTTFTPALYSSKSTTVLPGLESSIQWTTSDNGGELLPHPASITCLLPPDTGVTTDAISYLIPLF